MHGDLIRAIIPITVQIIVPEPGRLVERVRATKLALLLCCCLWIVTSERSSLLGGCWLESSIPTLAAGTLKTAGANASLRTCGFHELDGHLYVVYGKGLREVEYDLATVF